MRDRLKRAAVIYLILVVLGVAAYFAVQALKGGFSLAGGSGGGNVFQAETQESSGPSATNKPSSTSEQRPTAQLLAETQGGSGGTDAQAQTGNDTAQAGSMTASQDSSGGGINLAQMAGVLPVDTSSNITPQPGNIKTPVNQTQSSDIKIKPQIDLSGGALGGSGGGISLSGGIDLSSPTPTGGSGPKIDFSKVDVPGGGSAKKVQASGSPNPLTADMEKQLKSLYYDSHNLSAAKAKAKEILKMDPTNPTAKRYLSIIKAEYRAMKYEDAGESEKALAEWKKILRWDPNNRWAKKGVNRNQ